MERNVNFPSLHFLYQPPTLVPDLHYLYGLLGSSSSENGSSAAQDSVPKIDAVLPSSPSGGTIEIDSTLNSVVESIRCLSVSERSVAMLKWSQPPVFEYLERRVSTAEPSSFAKVVDSIHILAMNDVHRVRQRCFCSSDMLLSRLIDRVNSGDIPDAIVPRVSDLLRLLLDPSSGAEPLLTYFYEERLLDRLCHPLISAQTKVSPFTVETILDLVSFCICLHNSTAKAYFLRFGSLLKSLRSILTCSGSFPLTSKQVQLAAIRLVRAFLWQKDTQYLKHLSAFNIPCLILQLVHAHRPTGFTEGNMIYSAALEIVTFLCVNSQLSVIESLCKPGSESAQLIHILAEDSEKAHSELAQFMLRTMHKHTSLYMCSGGEDLMARHSIGSSRGRSLSPHPLVVPMPDRKRRVFHDEEDDAYLLSDEDEEIIPKTPGGSPDLISPGSVKRHRVSED